MTVILICAAIVFACGYGSCYIIHCLPTDEPEEFNQPALTQLAEAKEAATPEPEEYAVVHQPRKANWLKRQQERAKGTKTRQRIEEWRD